MNKVRLLEAFDLQEGVYFQQGLERNEAFEKKYLAIREKEKRIYTDEQVSNLPEIRLIHPHYPEWRVRQISMHRLVRYINQKEIKTILDIGCGNGWLSSHLAKTKAEVFALDVNEVELRQGSRVFKGMNNLTFIYADVLSNPFKNEKMFDLIVVASSIQYFSDVKRLIHSIQPMLTINGEIHILDSPIYNEGELPAARQRTINYYSSLGFPEIRKHYFHHNWKSLRPFRIRILYNPGSLLGWIRRLLSSDSPFPWVRITK